MSIVDTKSREEKKQSRFKGIQTISGESYTQCHCYFTHPEIQQGHKVDIIYRYDPFEAITLKNVPDSTAAMELLIGGNGRFVDILDRMHRRTEGEEAGEPMVIKVNPISMGLPIWKGGALAQKPFALVLGCSDARVPIESIFDVSSNDLFVVRIAGNVLGTECLGSIDYAVRHLKSLRLAVVLGHSECGAVSAAVEAYLSPNSYLDIASTHALRSLVDRIQISVRAAAGAIHEIYGADCHLHPGFRHCLRDVAVYLNAALTAYDLRREISGLDVEHPVRVVFAVYDLGTVGVHSGLETTSKPTFADAPTNTAEFTALTRQLAESEHVRKALSTS